MIRRILEGAIKDKLNKGKAIIIYGARQTGKTTLVRKALKDYSKDVLWLNADETDVRVLFEKTTSTRLKAIFGDKIIVVIDEAQRIHDAGLAFKLVTDQLPEIQLIVTGSSSFELANKTNEPLTGRKWEYKLFPLSFAELSAHYGLLEEKRLLSHRLVFGSYPEVVCNPGKEKEILKQLSDSYLYKDLLMIEGIRKADKLLKLLQALAFQVGNEVKYTELGQMAGFNYETAEKYVDILEKAFVIFRLGALSRNLRNELKKTRKIYFYDNGIMNALTSQFQPPELRKDLGALWENYLMSERQKLLSYENIWVNNYFWRTHEQQEIDYIEEKDGSFNAYEFKWNPNAAFKFSKTFTQAYPEHTTKIIHSENYDEFLTSKRTE